MFFQSDCAFKARACASEQERTWEQERIWELRKDMRAAKGRCASDDALSRARERARTREREKERDRERDREMATEQRL